MVSTAFFCTDPIVCRAARVAFPKARDALGDRQHVRDARSDGDADDCTPRPGAGFHRRGNTVLDGPRSEGVGDIASVSGSLILPGSVDSLLTLPSSRTLGSFSLQ